MREKKKLVNDEADDEVVVDREDEDIDLESDDAEPDDRRRDPLRKP